MKLTNNLKRIAVAYPAYQRLIERVEACKKLNARERTMYARELRLEAFACLDKKGCTESIVFHDSSTVMEALRWRMTVKGADFWCTLDLILCKDEDYNG